MSLKVYFADFATVRQSVYKHLMINGLLRSNFEYRVCGCPYAPDYA